MSSLFSTRGFINKTNWVDWLVSILLIAAIIIVAVCVCNNPNRDSGDDAYEEAFYSECGNRVPNADNPDKEHFTSPGASPTLVISPSDLDQVGDNDIGCCLVYYEQCGHCKNYKPKWNAISSRVNGKRVGGKRIKMYECGDDQNQQAWREVSSRFGIKGYPTILVKIGGKDADWVEYTGSRAALGEYLEKGV